MTERVAILSCPAFDDDAAYAAMKLLLAALGEIAEEIFARTANLLNLSCDVIFVDTSSTYFEVDVADELAELATALGEQEATGQVADQDVPDEAATRRFSRHSKDHRADLPQVVLGMAVTAEGNPVRCWTFPGTTSDQVIIKKIKDDLAGWSLHRVVGWRTPGSTSPPTAATSRRAAATTSSPSGSAAAPPRPGPRSPVPGATTPWPGTWRSNRSASATAPAPSGSSSATTPRSPPATR